MAQFLLSRVHAQNRGVYPLGMSPLNWGLMPAPGFTYTNQVLTCARDEAKGDDGASLPVTGSNIVILDMNTFASVSTATILGGARYSASATLPFARNDLTSNLNGNRNGGAGSGDSYYPPLILGWKRDRVAVRVLCGFLAPTGRFVAGGTDNVGSGYWTLAPSSGQTFYLTRSQSLAASAYEWYEIHSRQEGTRTHPGDTFNPDYSLMRFFPVQAALANRHGSRRLRSSPDDRQNRPADHSGPIADPLRGQRARFRNKSGISKSKAEFRCKVFRGIRGSIDLPGVFPRFSGSISF